MRLIDADKLIKGLKEDFGNCNAQKDLELWGVYEYIKEQPTAYDLDGVIDELSLRENAYSEASEKALISYGYRGAILKAEAMHEAMEIVKRGEVKDVE